MPVAPTTATSQTASGDWLYADSDIPRDTAWQFGTLPNGVRYAVRRNGVPPRQVSIRVRIDAGSLHESDQEQGYAHLLEHLLFRESKYLGQAEAIYAWQRLGATFGSDANADASTMPAKIAMSVKGLRLFSFFMLAAPVDIAPVYPSQRAPKR